MSNPFTVKTPEDVSAEEVSKLFVDVFTDFQKVQGSGHVFIHGPRGSGKSMIFRYMQPDCQKVKENTTNLSALQYVAVYSTVKTSDLKLTELQRLNDSNGSIVLNEHFMTLYFASKAIGDLCTHTCSIESTDVTLMKLTEIGKKYLGYLQSDAVLDDCKTISEVLCCINTAIEIKHREFLQYVRKLALVKLEPYNGALLGYMDFLCPMLSEIRELDFMPKESPIYYLIDDADNLTLTQVKILNSWVATRTSAKISLKISTQMRYPTYQTITGDTIDTPHDYSEINISTVYTSSKTKYKDRVIEIVKQRLKYYGIKTPVEEYFQENKEQEDKIRELAAKLRASPNPRGYTGGDDALRYARPDYIRSLKGKSKSGSTYSYSGLEQIIALSSGIIRFFLESAAEMYNRTYLIDKNKEEVKYIPHQIQTEVMKDQANEFFIEEFNKILTDVSVNKDVTALGDDLKNLIESLGELFSMILNSDRSERRIFSFAITDPHNIKFDDKLTQVLALGVRYSFLQKSTIGNKEGTGRVPLYILSRRLAPRFKLDPTSFAGYFFLTTDKLYSAMSTPKAFLNDMKKRVDSGLEPKEDFNQMTLFE